MNPTTAVSRQEPPAVTGPTGTPAGSPGLVPSPAPVASPPGPVPAADPALPADTEQQLSCRIHT